MADNPDQIREPEELLPPGRLNLSNLGVYFGAAITAEERRYANSQGLKLLAYCGIVPPRDGPDVHCPRYNALMGIMIDTARFGWRYQCPVGHRVSPLHNTFLQRARLNELGSDKIVKMIYCWLFKYPLNRMQAEVGVAKETAVAWYEYCRDVARKVALHDFEGIGGEHDVVDKIDKCVSKRQRISYC